MTETRTRRTLLSLLVATFLVAAGMGGGVATVATLSDTETVSITASADVRPTGPPVNPETETKAETATPTETPTLTETATPMETPTETEMETKAETPTPMGNRTG